MQEQHQTVERAETKQKEPVVDRLVSYEVDDATVICDRMNPGAWIKSEVVAELER